MCGNHGSGNEIWGHGVGPSTPSAAAPIKVATQGQRPGIVTEHCSLGRVNRGVLAAVRQPDDGFAEQPAGELAWGSRHKISNNFQI